MTHLDSSLWTPLDLLTSRFSTAYSCPLHLFIVAYHIHLPQIHPLPFLLLTHLSYIYSSWLTILILRRLTHHPFCYLCTSFTFTHPFYSCLLIPLTLIHPDSSYLFSSDSLSAFYYIFHTHLPCISTHHFILLLTHPPYISSPFSTAYSPPLLTFSNPNSLFLSSSGSLTTFLLLSLTHLLTSTLLRYKYSSPYIYSPRVHILTLFIITYYYIHSLLLSLLTHSPYTYSPWLTLSTLTRLTHRWKKPDSSGWWKCGT